MIPTTLTRLAQTMALAATAAALAAPTVALANSAGDTPAPDSFERYAAAHPFGHGAAASNPAPDAFERYAATHLTIALSEGRSPDTRDAAQAAQIRLADRRSPDTRDATAALQAQGGGSLSSLENVRAPLTTQAHQPGQFDWADAGIGAILALTLVLSAGSVMLLLGKLNRRPRFQAT
jgi:hypothetical protein